MSTQGGGGPLPSVPFMGFRGSPVLMATKKQLVALEQGGGDWWFLATAPVAEGTFGSIPLRPRAKVTSYSLGPGGQIALVNLDLRQTATTATQPIQEVGILGHPLAFQGRAPGFDVGNAYLLHGGLYASASWVPPRRAGRPVVLRVAHGRLQIVLRGWFVLGPYPTGSGLLVVRLRRFLAETIPGRRVYLWRPGGPPRPLLPRDLSVGEELAWSAGDVNEVVVAGRFHQTQGLFVAVPDGAVVPLTLPTGVNWSSITQASFAGQTSLFLADGLGLYVCDVASGTCGVVGMAGAASSLPVLAVTWTSAG